MNISPSHLISPSAKQWKRLIGAAVVVGSAIALSACGSTASSSPTTSSSAVSSPAVTPVATSAASSPVAIPTATKTYPGVLTVPGVFVGPNGAAQATNTSSAPVRIDLFTDYMCPYCGQFEKQNGQALINLVTAGKIVLVQHPMNFLDQSSEGTKYSTRAANDALIVAADDPSHYGAFHLALFENQPEEGSLGLTDAQLAKLAQDAGVPASVTAKFTPVTKAAQVDQITAESLKAGVQGTPAIYVSSARQKPVLWDGQTDLNSLISTLAAQVQGK